MNGQDVLTGIMMLVIILLAAQALEALSSVHPWLMMAGGIAFCTGYTIPFIRLLRGVDR